MFIGHIPAGYLATDALLRRRGIEGARRTRLLLLGMAASVAPDLDLLYFYLLSDRGVVHHAYWPHLPLACAGVLALVVGGFARWRGRRAPWLALGIVAMNVLLHLLLDTTAGGIRWLWPFSQTELAMSQPAARYGHWWLNFVLHWTFALEVALVAAALVRWMGRRRMGHAMAVFAILFLAACAGQAPPPASPAPDAALSLCPRGDAEADEAAALAASGGRAERRGDTLFIRPMQDGADPLVDNHAEGDSTIVYRYLGYLRAVDYHVVAIRYYEGGAYLAVRGGDGEDEYLPGCPVFSPDLRRVVAASSDLFANYDDNVIAVWRLAPSGFEPEWHLSGADRWGASDPVWRGPDVIDFTMHTLPRGTSDEVLTPMRLRLRDGGFSVGRR